MGHKLSTRPAEEKAEEAQKTIDEVLKSFEDKRNLYLDDMRASRGPNAAYGTTEVTGGRTVMEYSEIFYTEDVGPNSQITDAVGDFFNAADSSIDGDNNSAKHKAIGGIKGLIMAAIDGILGSTQIGVREMKTFIVLFLNNSFVRIDYVFFQQNIDVVKYLAAVRSTARLIVAEVAVLPIDMMKPSEISYLLSQAYDIQSSAQPDSGFADLGKYQTNIVQLSVLTRMLQEFLLAEDSKENKVAGTESIAQKSEALVSLSENVNKVLMNLKTPLPPIPTPNDNSGLTGGMTPMVRPAVTKEKLAPEKEQAIKDRYIDANLDAQALNKFFTSKQKIAGSIQDSEKSNILLLLKNTYVKFEEAYTDCSDTDEVAFSDAFTLWFEESNSDFGMWWYTFQRAADAIVVTTSNGTTNVVTKQVVWKGTKTWGKVAEFDSDIADDITTKALQALKTKYPKKTPKNKDGTKDDDSDDNRQLENFSDNKVRNAISKNYIDPPAPIASPSSNTE